MSELIEIPSEIRENQSKAWRIKFLLPNKEYLVKEVSHRNYFYNKESSLKAAIAILEAIKTIQAPIIERTPVSKLKDSITFKNIDLFLIPTGLILAKVKVEVNHPKLNFVKRDIALTHINNFKKEIELVNSLITKEIEKVFRECILSKKEVTMDG
jgi:hypothetical protein